MKRLAFVLILMTSLAHAEWREPLNTGMVPANQRPKSLERVSVDQRLGSRIPLDLRFRDEFGHSVRLGDVIGKKPIILTLAYFRCPSLCTLVLNGVVEAIRKIPLTIGKDFQVLTVSISPKEGPKLALAKKRSYLGRYARIPVSDEETGWRMLTGQSASIHRLADAVGFHYSYEAQYDEYAHPSVIMVLTPDGKVSQYLFGIKYSEAELEGALQRASGANGESRIGSKVNAVLLYCFHYDPLTGKWSPRIMNILRVFGAVTALGLVAFLTAAFLRERAT